MKKMHLLAAILGLAALLSGRAQGATLTLNFAGSFGPTTTLGGTALGADTAFTLAATFDTTTGIAIGTGAVEYAAETATFDIVGHGTYSMVPGSDVYVGLEDPTSNTLGLYGIALLNKADTETFGATFTTATPAFAADDPVPTVFSGLHSTGGFFNLTIPLQGGAGDLVVKDLVSDVSLASITLASVPEPGSLTLSAIGLAMVGVIVRLRTRPSA